MSATDHLDSLCLPLTDGRPVVLLLGQDAWQSGAHSDAVLEMALKRADRKLTQSAPAKFPDLLSRDPLSDDFYDWLADMYEQQPEPLWMETLSRLPLNAVFTSSIDPTISRALRINGRNVESVLSTHYNPIAPRNRRILHLTYLFGRSGEPEANERPPMSTQELRSRKALHAVPLLSRIQETTTALGVLLIDGLAPSRDWLDAETLSGIISTFSLGQVYWFGCPPDELTVNDEILQELSAPHGPITFVRERLSAALKSLELAHKIDLSSTQLFAAEGSVKISDRTLSDRTLDVKPATRLKVSTAASIVEDSWLAPPPPIGTNAEYDEFRRFHGQVEDARRLIEGILRGFAIERTFEARLRANVNQALLSAGNKQKPVLIHGQSGSGKSLALARLACNIRKEERYPVLLASRANRVPTVEELDDFCTQAEDHGAAATLVICDVNTAVSRYADLLRGFGSRGRRVVVVGSTYRIIDRNDGEISQNQDYLLEVPAVLDKTEFDDLAKLIEKWTGTSLHGFGSEYLLPAIYRILPDVRHRLAAGLAQEARVVEDDLRTRGSVKSASPPKPAGVLGEALVNAGLVDPKALLDQKIEEFLGVVSDSASKAINHVMVPGKLGCPVPVNLLMRAVGGSENLVDVIALFSGIDLFRWSSNDEDDVLVHPRLRVEAELISAKRLGTSKAETEIALNLFKNASPSSDGGCEKRFVLDLVHQLGPYGPYGQQYAIYYLDIARALSEIRKSVMDPSLMLQEARLRRLMLRYARDMPNLDRAGILEEARNVVDLALTEFCTNTNNPRLQRTCANLKVERAAIYGYEAVEQLKSGAKPDDIWQYYEAARDSARNAVFVANDSYTIDISLWLPCDVLDGVKWEDKRHAELVADIYDGLEQVDRTQLDFEERERFEVRAKKVGKTLGDNHLEQEALAELDRLGSSAGILLQARDIGGPLGRDLRDSNSISADDISNADRMTSFMKAHNDKIREDPRCLRYLLRGLWIKATQTYLFRGERAPLPDEDELVQEILSLLDALNELDGAKDPRTQYLRAVLMWRLRREHDARDIWKALSQETAFNDPRRVVRHHVWTESGGQPKLFHGRISYEYSERRRARVRVDGLRQEVELIQRDFAGLELRRNTEILGGFHIAFNFIGPIADPPSRLRGG